MAKQEKWLEVDTGPVSLPLEDYREARAAVNCMDEVKNLMHKAGAYSLTHQWLSGKSHIFDNMGSLSCPLCMALATLKKKMQP